jgi:DNA polymerase III delta subunit
MNLSKDLVSKGNNKFLVSSKEPYLVSEFVEKIQTIFNDYSYKMCLDIEDFLENFHRGDIFSNTPMILYLWELTADAVKELAPIVSQPTDDILIFAERKVLSKNKAYTSLKAECYPVKIDKMDDKACLKWISARLAERGLSYDRDVPKLLLEKKSNDMYAIATEIRKLEVLYGDKEIDIGAMRYVAESSDARIFQFMESLLHKRPEKTLAEFRKFTEDSYIKVVSMLIGYIEKVYRIASMKSQGMSAEDIAGIIGMNKFIVKTKYFTILAAYGRVKLIKLLDLFNDLDYNLRLSSLPKQLLFESYILKAFRV